MNQSTKNTSNYLGNAAPQRQRIVVIDNDTELTDLIHSHFTQEGFIVDVYPNIYELYNVDLTEANLMLIDIAMGNNAGLAAVEQAKQDPMLAHMGVIAYADSMLENLTVTALTVGADDYLLKPFTMRELSARVKSVLRHRA